MKWLATLGLSLGLVAGNPAMANESQNPIVEAGNNHAQTVCHAVKATVAELSDLNCKEWHFVVIPLATIERWNGTSEVITQIQKIFKWGKYAIQVPVATQTVSYRKDGEPLGSCLQSVKTPPLDTYNPN